MSAQPGSAEVRAETDPNDRKDFFIPVLDWQVSRRTGIMGLLGVLGLALGPWAVDSVRGMVQSPSNEKVKGMLIASGWDDETVSVTGGGKRATFLCDNPHTDKIEPGKLSFSLDLAGNDDEVVVALVTNTTTDANGVLIHKGSTSYALTGTDLTDFRENVLQPGCSKLT